MIKDDDRLELLSFSCLFGLNLLKQRVLQIVASKVCLSRKYWEVGRSCGIREIANEARQLNFAFDQSLFNACSSNKGMKWNKWIALP